MNQELCYKFLQYYIPKNYLDYLIKNESGWSYTNVFIFKVQKIRDKNWLTFIVVFYIQQYMYIDLIIYVFV